MQPARGFNKALQEFMFEQIQKEVQFNAVQCNALSRAVPSTSLHCALCTVHCSLLTALQVLDGARALREPGPSHVTMLDVQQFDAVEYYTRLLAHFPLLTSVVTAAATRPDSAGYQAILEVCPSLSETKRNITDILDFSGRLFPTWAGAGRRWTSARCWARRWPG